MSRPSFQFYHGDWISNAKLRRCTHEEKGVWIDVLCLMADSDEFGVIRWPLKDIAEAVHCKPAVLHSLIRKGVLKGADAGGTCEEYVYTPRSGRKMGEPVALIPTQDGPIWYSSKQVRDEHIARQRAANANTKGQQNASLKPSNGDAPKPTFGDDTGAISPTPSPASPEHPPTPLADAKGDPADIRVNGSTHPEGVGRRRGKAGPPEVPMPEGWEPDDSARVWTQERIAEHRLTDAWAWEQLDAMRDYARQHPKWQHADWNATWRNWVRKAIERRSA